MASGVVKYPDWAWKSFVAGYGWLTEYEAQRKACELWDGLTKRERDAVEAQGWDGHILTHGGAEGLINLRDALANAAVAA